MGVKSVKKDLFAHKSKSWDMNSKRVKNAKSIAQKIVENIPLDTQMHLLDLGAGTGLLSFFIAQKVGKITALDNSPSMLEMFDEKKDEFACQTDTIHDDFLQHGFETSFDSIISSMTIHHIEDLTALFAKLFSITKDGGFIALADLESEDGTFHSDNEGVFHYGFDTQALYMIAKEAGFTDIQIIPASKIQKPHRDFDIFLLIAQKIIS